MTPPPREGRLGPALLVLLLAAALITGVLVYRARTSDLALEVPKIDRQLGISDDAELPVELEFFVRFDEPEALVEIVGREDATIRTLASDVALYAEERVRCAWDGRDDDGDPVGPGNYRLRVVLPDQDRDMVFPERIRVRRKQPESVAVPVAGGPCERAPGGEPLQ